MEDEVSKTRSSVALHGILRNLDATLKILTLLLENLERAHSPLAVPFSTGCKCARVLGRKADTMFYIHTHLSHVSKLPDSKSSPQKNFMNPSCKLTYRRLVPPVLAHQKCLDKPDSSFHSVWVLCSSSVSQALIGLLSGMHFPSTANSLFLLNSSRTGLRQLPFWKNFINPYPGWANLLFWLFPKQSVHNSTFLLPHWVML